MLFKLNQIVLGFAAGFASYLNITIFPWWGHIIVGAVVYIFAYITVRFKAVRIPYIIIASVMDGVIGASLISDSRNIHTMNYILVWVFVIGIFALAVMSYEYNRLDEIADYPKKQKKKAYKTTNPNMPVNTNVPININTNANANNEDDISMVFRDGKYMIVHDNEENK